MEAAVKLEGLLALLSAPPAQFLNDKGQHGQRQRQPDSQLLQRLAVQPARAAPEEGRRGQSTRTVDAVGRLLLRTERQKKQTKKDNTGA